MANPYTTLYTVLNAAWEAGVIAKPLFFDMKFKNYMPANSIGIEFDNAPMSDANPGDTEHFRTWPVTLTVFASSDANRELMIEQLSKHMRAHDGASIKYKVTLPSNFRRTFGCWMVDVVGKEENFVTVGAW